MKDFYSQCSRIKEMTLGKKEVGDCKIIFLCGRALFHQAVYLTSTDQVIPDWFKSPFLGEDSISVIKSQFGDGGLSISNSILDVLFLTVV